MFTNLNGNTMYIEQTYIPNYMFFIIRGKAKMYYH